MKIRASIIALVTGLLCMLNAQAQNVQAGEKKAQPCLACHGPNGNSLSSMFPSIAGQKARYLDKQLRDFASGARKNPMMTAVASALSKEDMLDLAAYFANQTPTKLAFQIDGDRVSAGKIRAEQTACAACHLPSLKGQNEVPRLLNLHPDYIINQLLAFKKKSRTNDGGTMAEAMNLSDEDMENIAHWISSMQ